MFEDSVPGVLAGVAAGMNGNFFFFFFQIIVSDSKMADMQLYVVIWVPHAEVKALNPEETYGAREILTHLEEWAPTKWNLPSLPGFGNVSS